jgi:hypothetical protein
MKVDGRCHCGAIAYTAEVDPAMAAICHCADCQSFSGSPFRASAPTKVEDFRLLSGAPKTYVKTADSGARRVQAFCGECGSPIYASDVEKPKILHLRLGGLRQRSEIRPRRQIFQSSALPWAFDIGALPSSPRQ